MGERTAFEMKASEETDAFWFDLCLPHSALLLKGFKVVISGIMVCYVVSSHGAKRSLLWWFFYFVLHCISQQSIVIQNSERPFFFSLSSSSVQVHHSDTMAITAHINHPVLLLFLWSEMETSLPVRWEQFPGREPRFVSFRKNKVFLRRWALIVFVALFHSSTMKLSWEKCA